MGLTPGFLPWHIECVVKYIKRFDLYGACWLLKKCVAGGRIALFDFLTLIDRRSLQLCNVSGYQKFVLKAAEETFK